MAELGETMPVGALALGFVASFLSGILAIRWLLKILAKGKFVYFAIYCAVLGVVALFTT
jgi:undecaprenyl-diphosphatase